MALDARALEGRPQILLERFVAAHIVDHDLALDRIDLIARHVSALLARHEALQARPSRLGFRFVEILRDLPVPGIADEGELEIVPPNLFPHISAHAPGGHVLVIADAWMIVALGPHQELPPKRAPRLQRMLDAII